jgi:dienelactone hydrolase
MPDTQEPRPAVVVPQGTVGLKEHYRSPLICQMLAKAGFVAMTFDYRGFGESEGPPTRIVPHEQVRDVRNALTYVASLPGVDADRLGLLGFCWGGSHSISAAGLDSRVKCVVEVGGIGDGTRWLRSLRSIWDWHEFLCRLDTDRARRVRTGRSEVVRFGEVLIGSPMARAGRRRIVAEIAPPSPPYATPDTTLETAELMLEYRPEEVIGRIAPRPVLLMHGAADDLAPVEEAHALYAAAGDPKKLIVFPGAYHHDVYLDPLFWEVMTHTTDWFQRWLDPPRPPSA